MSCAHCADTGSLSKDLHGLLDCGHCSVATERSALAARAREWVRENDPIECLWLAYQQGKAAGAHAQPQ
jgi:hypothetical protein